MKNKINNESNTKYINNKEKEKNIYEFKERMNKANNLIEYFAIIGLDQKISTKDFLYELNYLDGPYYDYQNLIEIVEESINNNIRRRKKIRKY